MSRDSNFRVVADGSTEVGCVLMVILAFVVWSMFLSPIIGSYAVVSEGSRAGQVVKLSHKGILCKTWEGEMVLGGVKDGVVNTFEFSIHEPAIIEKLQTAVDSQKPVKVAYKETWDHWFCSRDTNYVILSVE